MPNAAGFLLTIVLAFSPIWSPIAAASSPKRLALVIGNDKYQEIGALQKARNDARSVGAVLGEIGFTVSEGYDLSYAGMSQALNGMEAKIEPGDTVFFFFSGHGVTIDTVNYLLPVDIPSALEGQKGIVRDNSYSASSIIDRFRQKGARLIVSVLDACRNDPFRQPGGRGLNLGRGLSRMTTEGGGPLGASTFTLFSAGENQEARDRLTVNDPNPNSVFTRLFIVRLKQPNLSLIDLAKKVQQEVHDLAATVNHVQTPAYYDGVLGNVYLIATAPPQPDGKVPANKPADDKPTALQIKSTSDGRNRFKLSELLEFENILPRAEECEEVGQRLLGQLPSEMADNLRFWVRAGARDFGYCQKGRQRWYVQFLNRDLEDGIVVAFHP